MYFLLIKLVRFCLILDLNRLYAFTIIIHSLTCLAILTLIHSTIHYTAIAIGLRYSTQYGIEKEFFREI